MPKVKQLEWVRGEDEQATRWEVADTVLATPALALLDAILSALMERPEA